MLKRQFCLLDTIGHIRSDTATVTVVTCYFLASSFDTAKYLSIFISPLSDITGGTKGTSLSSVSASLIAYTTSIPLSTLPNTTFLPSSHLVCIVVIKNDDPFWSPPPALAMLTHPAP